MPAEVPSASRAQSPRKRRSLIARLIAMAWGHRGRLLITLFWAVLAQALSLASYLFAGLAIDVLHAHASADTPMPDWPFALAPPEEWGLLRHVSIAAGLVLGFTLLRSVVHFFARVSDERVVQLIIVDLRTQLYEKLHRMSFRYFDTHDSGGLINRVTADAQSVRQFIQGVLLRLIVAAASLTIFLVYMLREHLWLTLATLTVIPLQAGIMWSYGRTIQPRFRTLRESMDRLIQTMQEAIIGVQVVKGFGQDAQMMKRFAVCNDDASARRLSIAHASSSHLPALPACAFLQLAILLGYGGYLVHLGPASGGIALGTIWVFLSLLRQLSQQIDAVAQSASSIPDALTGAERAFELIDAPIEIADHVDACAPESVTGRITFENVSFRYGDGPMVLEDINLDIQPGETVALVGPSGSGKTTLLHLVSRFHDSTTGKVTIDGVNVRNWPLEHLRRAIGVVFQEAFLFSNTITANIAFGWPANTPLKEARLHQAAEDAVAHEFIPDLSHQYDTIIGERGLTLSGGERQRLTLARAFLIEPPILVLDDATASVDARTEAHIQQALDRLMHGRTTLIVAHRLSMLRRADRIVVIEQGRITAVGTHDELMETNQHYRRSAQLQLEREQAEGEAKGEFDTNEEAPG